MQYKIIVHCLVLLLSIFHFNSQAQKAILHNDRPRQGMYSGVANSISIIADGYACKNLVVTASHGKIENTDGCRYTYYGYPGVDVIFISVKTKTGRKFLDSLEFRVNEFPNPMATVGGYPNGDSITVGNFKAQAGVGADSFFYGYELAYTITSFHFIIMKEGKIIFEQTSKGNSFTNIKQGITQLEPGQTVLIGDIVCVGEDGKKRNLLPIQYFIK